MGRVAPSLTAWWFLQPKSGGKTGALQNDSRYFNASGDGGGAWSCGRGGEFAWRVIWGAAGGGAAGSAAICCRVGGVRFGGGGSPVCVWDLCDNWGVGGGVVGFSRIFFG